MSKILITGTGRCGTTFLIKLFTFLGFDTGFETKTYKQHISKNCNSGMEKSFTDKSYVLKNPSFIENIDKIISQNISIKYMIIPIRNYNDSAESRVKHGAGKPGGLLNASNKDEQLQFYYRIMANYLYYMTKYDINTIFIDFDKMITDKSYLYGKLKLILDEKNIDIATFNVYYEFASLSSRPAL